MSPSAVIPTPVRRPLGAFLVNFLPQNAFCMFHVFAFGVGIYLAHDALYLLQFKVDDIVHDALGQIHAS